MKLYLKHFRIKEMALRAPLISLGLSVLSQTLKTCFLMPINDY